MTKPQHYILLVYCLLILLGNIYLPLKVQLSENIGQRITRHIETQYYFVWDAPNRFDAVAMGLDWQHIVIEFGVITIIAGISFYSTRQKGNRTP